MSAHDEWVVAVRLRQLGDVLAALATLRALKSYRPERRIAYVVEAPYADLLRGLDFIDALPSPRAVVPERGVRYRTCGSSVQLPRSISTAARSALITLARGRDARRVRRARPSSCVHHRGTARRVSRRRARAPTPIVGGAAGPSCGGSTAEALPPPVGVRGRAHTRSRRTAAIGILRATSKPVGGGAQSRSASAGEIVVAGPLRRLGRRIAADGRRALCSGVRERKSGASDRTRSGSAAVLAPPSRCPYAGALGGVCSTLVTIDWD
jgi:hypothetical protein